MKIKKMGKYFIDLKQEDENIIKQSVLMIDSVTAWTGYLTSGAEKIKGYFPNAEFSILTSKQRQDAIQEDLPAFDYIITPQRSKQKQSQSALQMLKLQKREYNFIVLFSLDIAVIIVALFFFRAKVLLYNRWGQIWSLRLRHINEIFKPTYIKKKARFGLNNILRRIGLFFVLVQREDEKALRHSILIVDNGYALFEQLECAIRKLKESLPHARISVLALRQRSEFKGNLPGIDIVYTGGCVIKRYRLARHMIRLRKNKYDYIILLSLDITPVIVSILFVKGKALLYNQWHQWWSLNPKSLQRYLLSIPEFVYNVFIFIYLLVSVFWISLKRLFNVFGFSALKKRL